MLACKNTEKTHWSGLLSIAFHGCIIYRFDGLETDDSDVKRTSLYLNCQFDIFRSFKDTLAFFCSKVSNDGFCTFYPPLEI